MLCLPTYSEPAAPLASVARTLLAPMSGPLIAPVSLPLPAQASRAELYAEFVAANPPGPESAASIAPDQLAQDTAPPAQRESKALPSVEELKKLPPDGRPDYNRLVFEKSPYLLQHARNPVDWFPWGEEAFAKARAESKPIFLSIGYSTCHWCHVMERESFEDPEVAALLNKDFVAIKVDREERPDIDQVYMRVTQAITGSGGWPMTIVMTPDKKPFFAGTYFPKHGVHGMAGLMDILAYLADAWKTQHENVVNEADKVVGAIRALAKDDSAGELDANVAKRANDELAREFDAERGGFGTAQKFPIPHQLRFLLRFARTVSDAGGGARGAVDGDGGGGEHALEMVERTLQAIARGGIRDHVGFGFHRYSTDREWLVPHFEKMLYDQALNSLAYVEAYEATRKPEYRDVAREVFEYVLRDMTSPDGGFYSAEDADSAGQEGLFYTWTAPELAAALGEPGARLFGDLYGVPMSELATENPARHVLHLVAPWPELAKKHGITEAEMRGRIEPLRKQLFEARERRVHPAKDDKIIAGWNGLMIAALAHGARAFGEPRYETAARRAADFVLSRLRDSKDRLSKRYARGTTGIAATADDYAYYLCGLIDLYETDFDAAWIADAIGLERTLTADFWDEDKGGYFFAAKNGEALLTSSKDIDDLALPSSNSAAALALIELSRITGNPEYEARANRIFKAFAKTIAKQPSAHSQMLIALDLASAPSLEIVLVGGGGSSDADAMLAALRSRFLPNAVVVFKPTGREADIALENKVAAKTEAGSRPSKTIAGSRTNDTTALAPYTESMKSLDGKTTAYVCRNFACEPPTHEVSVMMRIVLSNPKKPEKQ
jgi:uncharacterized protein